MTQKDTTGDGYTMVTIQFTPDEFEKLSKAAQKAGITPEEYVV